MKAVTEKENWNKGERSEHASKN